MIGESLMGEQMVREAVPGEKKMESGRGFHPTFHDEEEDRGFVQNRIRFLMIGGWIGIAASLIMSAVEFSRNAPFRVLPSILFSVVAPFLLLSLRRNEANYRKILTGFAALILIQQILGAFLTFNEVLMVIWYPVFPLTYFFLLGYRRAAFWNMAALAGIVAGYFLFPFVNSTPPVPLAVFSSGLLAYAVATALAWYHYRVIHSYQNQLKHEAVFDPLTEALLRKAGLDRLEKLMAQVDRRPERDLSVALFDIDDFKRINDQEGHQAGDRILVQLSESVRRSIRKEDLFVRLGGEEFLLVLPDQHQNPSRSLFECLRVKIEDEVRCQDGSRVTVSIGLTQYRPREKLSTLLHRADNLMYAAKKTGKNKITWDRSESGSSTATLSEFSPSEAI